MRNLIEFIKLHRNVYIIAALVAVLLGFTAAYVVFTFGSTQPEAQQEITAEE